MNVQSDIAKKNAIISTVLKIDLDLYSIALDIINKNSFIRSHIILKTTKNGNKTRNYKWDCAENRSWTNLWTDPHMSIKWRAPQNNLSLHSGRVLKSNVLYTKSSFSEHWQWYKYLITSIWYLRQQCLLFVLLYWISILIKSHLQ